HPIVLVRSEFGFTDKDKNNFLTPNRVKELRSVANVKNVIEMKGMNYRTVLEGHENGLKLGNAVDSFVEQYDIHRQVEIMVESVRNSEEQEQIDKIYFPNKIRTYEERFRRK